MRERALRIVGSGVLCSVGLDAASSAAALRTRINCFERIRLDDGEHDVTVAPLPAQCQAPDLDPAEMLGHWMAEAAMQACETLPALGLGHLRGEELPVLACVSELMRPGRPARWDHQLIQAFVSRFGKPATGSRTVAQGSVGLAHALAMADELLYRQQVPAVLIAAADSYLLSGTLDALNAAERCIGPEQPAGFVPGEAAAALLLTRMDEDAEHEQLLCTGIGLAHEEARLDNHLPNAGSGLCKALRQACNAAAQDIDGTDLLLADLSGEAFYAEEHALSSLRAFQECPVAPALWLPAESLGNTGAVSGLIATAWLHQAHLHDYAPGFNTLCQLQADDGQRAALTFTYL